MSTVSWHKRVLASAVVAAALSALLASASAQGVGGGSPGGHRGHRTEAPKTGDPKPKADDKAYRSALKGLPDKPFDPWRAMR